MTRRVLSVVLFALLACNTIYYIGFAGRSSQALDSMAWYVLLILFTVEGLHHGQPFTPRMLRLMRGLRLVAAVFIVVSAVLYVGEQAWLDAANVGLWLLVVLMLEIQVRYPALVAKHKRVFAATALLLYGSLAVLVALWLLRRMWMDAWDATVWLCAFALLEMRLQQGDAAAKPPA